jgi:uncharacterized protein
MNLRRLMPFFAAMGMIASCGLMVMQPAHAEAKSCKGIDVVAELKEKQPATYAALKREEAKIRHGEGLLFRMEKKGHPILHVFGTIHVDDKRFKDLPKPLMEALESADIVATEIREDELNNPVSMLKMAALAANPKADTLNRMKPESRRNVEKALEARGLPVGAAMRMDAGFLLLSLALPPCAIVTDPETVLKQEVVDQKVARVGAAYGAENIGLETVAAQVQTITGMSDASKFAMLDATAAVDDRSEDMFATMKALYLEKKIARLSVLSSLSLPPDPAVQGAYAEFMDRLIDKRNIGMVEGILKHAANKKVVAAIGALHLVGDRGVVHLLEKKGYKATRLW